MGDNQNILVEVRHATTDEALSPERRSVLAAALSEDERQRIAATDHPALETQRLVGYHLRRLTLARWLGVRPEEVPLELQADGQTRVRGAERLAVSLSHTFGLVVVAVADGARIGVDVEQLRSRRNVQAIAARFFHPGEAARIAGAAPPDRPALFFRMWTRKESLAKASGQDLFRVLGRARTRSRRWQTLDLALSPGHAAALTVGAAGQPISIRCQPSGRQTINV